MRVSIDHSQKTTGFLSKTTHYVVTLKVEFSEEEKAIIKKRDLGDAIVLERDRPTDRRDVDGIEPDFYNLRIRHLLKEPNEYACRTPQDAKAYEAALTEAMPQLKAYIMENAEVETKSKSFEL